ncbi:baseplate J/gp47 family protein [Actinoplanes sp. NPDC023714]|uniref:baseplate J/gp47 family protein n=1 Tax=Actinoplanes sp. NPDC023714 TaxID=3154322 RepID=UPI0033FDC156
MTASQILVLPLRHPPAAASVDLVFTREGAAADRISIPAGTCVAAGPVVFSTAWSVAFEPGQTEASVRAYHGETVDGELIGVATGEPGQLLRVARAPIAATGDAHDVLLGVARPDGSPAGGAPARVWYGVTYELWEPVSTFAGVAGADRVYFLDRASGTILFAPELDLRDTAVAGPRALAALPPAGAAIRVWYRTGGGPDGNVAANTVTALREPVPGLRVTNPSPARGGRPLEDRAGWTARRQYALSTQRRAVTAADIESLATGRSEAIARAGAFAPGSAGPYGRPGQILVSLVPRVTAQARPGWRLPAEALTAHQDAEALRAVQRLLDGCCPLGSSIVVGWARYKPVSVRGRVTVPAQEDPDAVRARLHERLHQMISPLPAAGRADGRRFGEPLRAADVRAVVEQSLPEKSRVDELRFVVREAPDARVRDVAVDPARPDVWYATGTDVLFRSTDGGAGWEPAGRFPDEEIRRVAPAPPHRPGALAVVTATADAVSRVYLSDDFGEHWTRLAELPATVTGVAWVDRAGAGALLLSADDGLHELPLAPGAVPLRVMVDPADPDRGLAAVVTFAAGTGVAVAAQGRLGVHLSTAGGRQGTFQHIGLADADVRTLAVQDDGTATYLWAGLGEADPSKPGKGCHRARLFENALHWEPLAAGWTGGTCWDLAVDGRTVLAASQSAGTLRYDTGAANPSWAGASVNSGLPLRDRTRFEPVTAVAAGAGGRALAGTARGVYREAVAGQWSPIANREAAETVTIPPTWLFCSDEHDVQVVPEIA